MENINFQPVFDYIDKTKEEIIGEIMGQVATKEDIRGLQSSIDGLAKQTKDNTEKVAGADAKASQLEGWVIQAAEKIEVPYKP
jgi:hypothetical protein